MDLVNPIVVRAVNGGIGDHVFFRPAVRRLSRTRRRVIVRTAWPELYHDLDVGFERPDSIMRMERRSAEGHAPETWIESPAEVDFVDIGYRIEGLGPGRTPSRFALLAAGDPGWASDPIDVGLPLNPAWTLAAKARLVSLGYRPGEYSVVVPPTLRKEWLNPARAPKPEYVRRAVETLPGPWISLGAHEAEAEWVIDEDLPADARFHRAEIGVGEMAALLKMARVTVTGHCFAMALALAVRARVFVVWGGFHPPEYYVDDSMLHPQAVIAAPADPCRCGDYEHDCPRDVDIDAALTRLRDLRTGSPCR